MRIFRKIVLVLLVVFVLIAFGGYLYFDQKFSPSENYLNVSGDTENIPVKWISDNDNPYSVLLLPVKIQSIDKEFYMQLDFGSPTTVFYKNALQSLAVKFPEKFGFNKNVDQIALNFELKDLKINSQNFKLLDYGNALDSDDVNAENCIGTIGTDLLEKRIITMDFKHNFCSFSQTITEKGFTNFEFKKRRILLPAQLENQSLKLLYDSGTSGYELITNKENWDKIRIPNTKIKKEKGNSWGNTLTVISAPANKNIKIGNLQRELSEVTYITGTSQLQNFLMKQSGMQGMIGNKLFINHKLILDCKNQKFKIE